MRFIGCKRLLLENIKEVVDEKAPNAESFCDLFSGTATVARYFKQKNKSYNCDGVSLLKQIHGDVLYLDPPYTERQYLPNYHVLETAARYDFPKVRGVTGQRLYDHQKSDFCQKAKVEGAFEELIKNAQFRHIILSYSTDGIMSLDTIEETMKKYGKPETFQIYEIPYRRYKSRNATLTEPLKELLIYIEKE